MVLGLFTTQLSLSHDRSALVHQLEGAQTSLRCRITMSEIANEASSDAMAVQMEYIRCWIFSSQGPSTPKPLASEQENVNEKGRDLISRLA